MRYKNLVLIGSSHISIDSVNMVKKTIEKEKPGVVAVELDPDRLVSLFHKEKKGFGFKGVGIKGFLFALIAHWAEQAMGKTVNVEPGTEMKTAILEAKKQNAKVALIDQHIKITLKRFSQTITWKEKWNFVADIFLGIFAPKRQMKEMGVKLDDLSKVPSKKTIAKLLLLVKRRYPNVYNVLVHERNVIMARNLYSLMKHHEDETIVAIVGAGHEDEIIKLIKENYINRQTK